jgi:hypothetical protein
MLRLKTELNIAQIIQSSTPIKGNYSSVVLILKHLSLGDRQATRLCYSIV